MPTTFTELPADALRIVGNFLDGESLLPYVDVTPDSYDWVFGNRYQAALLEKHWDRAYGAVSRIPDITERTKVLKHLAQSASGLPDPVRAFDQIYTAAERIEQNDASAAARLYESLATLLPSLQGRQKWTLSPASTPEQRVLESSDAFADALARLQTAEERLWRSHTGAFGSSDVSSGILSTLRRLENDVRETVFDSVFDAVTHEDGNLGRPALSAAVFNIRNLPEHARKEAFDRAFGAAKRAPTNLPMFQLASVVPYLPRSAQQDAFRSIYDLADNDKNKSVLCGLAHALEIWPEQEALEWFKTLYGAVGDIDYSCDSVMASVSFSEALPHLPERFRLGTFMDMLKESEEIKDPTSRAEALESMARAIPSLLPQDREEALEATYIRGRTIRSAADRGIAFGALGEIVTDVPDVDMAFRLILGATKTSTSEEYKQELLDGMARTVWDCRAPDMQLAMFDHLLEAAMRLNGSARAQVLSTLAKKALPYLQEPEGTDAVRQLKAFVDTIEPEFQAGVLGALGKGMPKFQTGADLQSMCHQLNTDAARFASPGPLAKLLVGVAKGVESVQPVAAYSARIPPQQRTPVAAGPRAQSLG